MKKNNGEIFLPRVLRCLDRARTKEEVLIRYDELYPPTRFERIIGILKRGEVIEGVSKTLTYLIQEEYVKTEVFSFTDQPLYTPLVKYSLTQKGLQEAFRKTRKNQQ